MISILGMIDYTGDHGRVAGCQPLVAPLAYSGPTLLLAIILFMSSIMRGVCRVLSPFFRCCALDMDDAQWPPIIMFRFENWEIT